MKQTLLFYFLIGLGICTMSAQNNITHREELFTMGNGLAGYFANYTLKDSIGIIWMGTQHGLHRFDGRDFRVFSTNDGLAFNEVMEIYEDAAGFLWLYRSCHRKPEDYCYKALSFFHSVSHTHLSIEDRFPEGLPFKVEDIQNIKSNAAANTLIIQTNTASYKFSIENGFEEINFETKDSNPFIFKVLNDGKLGVFSKQDSSFWEQDERIRLLLSPRHDYYLLSPSGNLLQHQSIAEIISNLIGVQGQLGFNNSFHGLLNINSAEQMYLIHLKENGELQYADLLTALIKDLENHRHFYFDWEQNTLWAAGAEGILRKEFISSKFYLLNFKAEGQFKDMIRYIALHPERELIMASHNNVYKTSADDLFQFHPNSPEELQDNISTQIGDSLNLKDFPFKQAFSPLSQLGMLSAGTEGAFQIHYLFQEVKGKKSPVSVNVSLAQGKLHLLGTNEGLVLLNREAEEIFKPSSGKYAPLLSQSVINCILPLNEDLCWLGTNKGLFLHDQSRGVIQYFGNEGQRKEFLPLNIIYDIEKTNGDTLWLACRDGLFSVSNLNSDTPALQKFQVADGLPDNNCVSVIKDNFGFLWIATVRGLVQTDLKSHKMKIHKAQNGLPQEYFMEHVHLKDEDGRIYLGGNKGVVYFDPNDFKEEQFELPKIPLSIIEYEQYNGQSEKFELKTAELLETNKVLLRPNSKVFSLRVALAHHSGAKEQRYAYRIKGVQDQWVEDQSNLLRFSGLPYGKHRLEIRGRLADGRYSSEVLNISIEVLRPFYFRWWFISLCLLFLGMAILGYIKTRTYQLKI